MPHDLILQRIRINISTLSKYVGVKKQKKHIFVPVGTSTRYKCPPSRLRGEETFVPGRDSTQYKCEAFVLGISPSTNAPHHLYGMVYTGWILGTNKGSQPAQMSIF
jgi:hypothetical protein